MRILNKLKKMLKTNTLKGQKDSFILHLEAIISSCVYYYYHEGCYEHYRPCTVPAYSMEPSSTIRARRYAEIWEKLDTEYGIDKLQDSWNLFEDEKSKYIFSMRILNNLYDHPLVRLPIFYSDQYDILKKIEKLAINDNSISLWNGILSFKEFSLHSLGFDLTIWGGPDGIFIEFIREQYNYKNIVRIEEGDVVIDGGACYGETALHFVLQGASMVYSFEFMPENTEMFKKNLSLNPKYKEHIRLMERPLGARSGEKLYAIFNGPGTSMSTQKQKGAFEFTSISIDDFVKENNLQQVDFIKLDIEGSEEVTLRGAADTIRRFKPKLAVCGYHKKDDLIVLPQLIKSLLPEYALYLNHYTINNTETVIYASPKAS